MKYAVQILMFVLILAFTGCGGSDSARHIHNLGNTPYQEDTILVTLSTNPDRALVLLDSAVLLGNIGEYREQYIRASIFTKSLNVQQQDSALAICKALLNHDSVRNEPANRESVLNLLISVCRAKTDFEAYLRWALEKAELCREQGEEVEQWLTN